MKRAALLLALLLATAAQLAAPLRVAAADPGSAQAPAGPPVTPAAPAPAAAASAEAPFLWQVKVGEGSHMLLGSVHLLPKAAHPLPVGLEQAYEHADTLVFESDLGALDAPEMQREVLAAARGEGLRKEIPPAMYERVQAQARAYGLPDNVCEPYAAWFCAMTLEIFGFQHQGFDAALGLDQHFYARAAADNKTVAWLEAPTEHMKLFTGMDAELGRSFLAATLDEEGDPEQQPAALLQAWQTGDTGYVEQLDLEMKRDYPGLYERLLAARNRAWLPGLVSRMKLAQPQLIIVGAAHLVGPDGLVQALRLRGFEVRRLSGPGAAPAAAEPATRPVATLPPG